MELRPYQQAAVAAVYDHLRRFDDNPCIVLPTGAGKSLVMAEICKDAVGHWGGRVLILAHVRELLEQTADKLQKVCPDIRFGIYSAGLGRRDTSDSVILAGIQSVYQKAELLGRFDLVIVDEGHLIPLDGDGMYRTFLTAAQTINPQLRVIGLTATPFRLQAGPICLPPPEGILNSICYEAGVKELIQAGYLAPLKSKAGVQKPDLSRLHVRQGEFVAEEVELAMNQDPLVYAACREIAHYMRDRKSCLLFASSIAHGRKIADTIRQVAAQECGFLDGDSASLFRAATIDRFRDGSLKYLCNVNVLTTGFDAPNIDCIALLRPTLSAGLFYQMVGRGLRLFPGKADCLILDFAGNILRHGPIDQIRINKPCKAGSGEAPAKECTACHALLACGYGVCPDCGYVFPPSDKPLHDAEATDEGILSGQVMQTVYEVRDVFYSVHAKKDADPEAPKTMRVDYRVGLFQRVSEWICFEHAGWPRRKAEEWWRQRSSDPVPASAQQAVDIAEAGGVATPKTIAVRSVAGEKFDRIVGYELGEKPEAVLQTFPTSSPDDEIPF